MKIKGMKKIPKPLLIKGIVVVLILLGIISLVNFMNSGTLDEQIKREERINNELANRSVNEKVRRAEFRFMKKIESIKQLPVHLTTIDNLRTELDEIIEKKNLDRKTMEKYWKENFKNFHFDEQGYLIDKPLPKQETDLVVEKLLEKKKNLRLSRISFGYDKSHNVVKDVPEDISENEEQENETSKTQKKSSPEYLKLLKLEYLKELKQYNRQLAGEVFNETFIPGVKKKKLEKLEKVRKEYSRMFDKLCDKGAVEYPNGLPGAIVDLRMQLEVLKKIPPVRKPKDEDKDKEDSRGKVVE